MKLSLPVKFALLSFIVTLIGVIGVALVAYIESDRLLQEEAVHGLSINMAKELQTLEHQAELVRQDVAFLAQSPAIRALANGLSKHQMDSAMINALDAKPIETLFSTVLQQRNMYYQIRLIGVADEGREMVRVARLKQGIEVIASDLLQRKGQRDYFRNSIILKAGTILFSNITLNREHGKITLPPQPMLRVSTTIYNDAGQLCGILLINVNFNVLTQYLQSQQGQQSFFIANQQGDYLIHPDPQKAMAFEYQRQANLSLDYDLNDKTLQRLLENEHGVIKQYLFDAQGEALLLGRLHFDDEHEESYLRVGAVVELAQLRSLSKGLRDRMLLLTLILALILAVITFFIARYLTRPIGAMIDAAVKISNGDEHVNIPANSKDEIGVLGGALQQMLLHLGETRRKTDALNVVLEVKVSKRTAELARLAGTLEAQNTELERAVLTAENAATAKSQFLATMSHEIRTPLNGVLGLTELVLNSELSSPQRENLKTIQASGEALLAILNDILDFSKIEAGLMDIHRAEFDPNHVIEHVAKLFSGRVNGDETTLELIVHGIPHLPHLLMGDAGRLQQVLMNLLSNAVKFTSKGEIVIAAQVITESATAVRLRFQIRDTGNGISPADQKELFKEFTQADGSDTRKHGGTGLGLAIVKRLVELMGGDIQVESEMGKGSCFFFELDMEKASPVDDRPQDYHQDFSRWRILVVDDHASNRAMLHDVLTAWGMHCNESAYGNAAFQGLQSMASIGLHYDVILIDQLMDGMDGMALARLIKEDPQLDDLKVIMTTSLDMTFDAALCDKHGIDGFMRKPIYIRSLFETILSVMGVRSREVVHQYQHQTACRTERILLAEDNVVNQQVAIGMLKNQGFENVDVANHGVEALELFAQHHYDLVFMDIQMPKLDGIAATREIRELESLDENEAVPIVALTAHALDEDKQRTHEVGMNDHMTKPLTGKALQAMLAQWLPLTEQVGRESAENLKPQTAHVQTAHVQTAHLQIEAADKVEASAIDASSLRQLRLDMGFGIGLILDTYVEELPKQRDALIAAIEAGDADELRRCGHRLKGSSRSVAAQELGELCYTFEQLGQSNDLDAASALIENFKQYVEQVQDAFSASWLDEIR
ncbi:MAG: response regulator [Mariprofundus sp.]|nr:response regulator [Mariprofundus sp.]